MREGHSLARLTVASAAAVTVPVAIAAMLVVPSVDADARLNAAILVALFGLPISFLHFVLLGLPAYAVLSRRWPLTAWAAAAGGFAVAAIPMPLLSLASPGFETYRQGQVMLIEDGRYTMAGYLSLLGQAGSTGLIGAMAGIAFWAVLAMKKGGPLPGRP
ncbi:MAG: hypothetical protein JOZ90_08000 [Alphaproteobacteria bacterium]|nr:hypothetical protein [Alphaproteobacteria bacterium]MBV9371630.1 hypothetical protein [Alphaproteobacteria bacterium]MBV9901027.1 hypothetical protein [Alphaproteobacteria bacterium]